MPSGKGKVTNNQEQLSGLLTPVQSVPIESGVPTEVGNTCALPPYTSDCTPPALKPDDVEALSTCWKRRSPTCGARGPTLTDTELLVTDPREFSMVTRKVDPSSPGARIAVLKTALVAPRTAVPFSLH